jgi:hypothetical protein
MDEAAAQVAKIVLPTSAKLLRWAIAGMAGLAASAIAEQVFDKGYAQYLIQKTGRIQ